MDAHRPTIMAKNGAVTSPHYLASQAGIKILQNGGNAIHAAIAIASTLSVVYPHMNGLGGDNFWLIYNQNEKELKGLNASGRAGGKASIPYYKERGFLKIPERGGLSANTVPGALSGWVEAYHYAEEAMDQSFSWEKLLEDAIDYAENGFPITDSQIKMADQFLNEEYISRLREKHFNNFYSIFLSPIEKKKAIGALFFQKDLATTLRKIASDKGYSFYHGELAEKMVNALHEEDGVLQLDDFSNHRADWISPLSVNYRGLDAYNLPPNTQGIASLSILNILNQFNLSEMSAQDPDYYHLIVEATKLAFRDRDEWVTDQNEIIPPTEKLLSPTYAQELAKSIGLDKATKLQTKLDPKGDTVWFGVVDKWGNAVSMIQSIYHEYGSTVVPKDTGILLQNRGCFFSLDPDHINSLKSGKRTFHTLNPAMLFKNGRPYLVYGTMGGEGQPQTQAALVTKIVDYGYDVQAAIEAPRWLYGRTWGAESNSLKVENRINPSALKGLLEKGHEIEKVDAFSDMMGHAGIIKIDSRGVKFAGADPRSDGQALGY
ncbi:gamma-glutamyltranspeptidase/glutathione hydrolase [Saliterribacillus persicus]|uniref:Glutathione hydrolase proenzyme n=2 Tax=Saliterribacillus persicus TaxID=930114 RepID=A0A368XUX7_9BACI|nr:gamma-glutamyltranspeptidase/glutathione hydrolase [Saliterribacillus persicus]